MAASERLLPTDTVEKVERKHSLRYCFMAFIRYLVIRPFLKWYRSRDYAVKDRAVLGDADLLTSKRKRVTHFCR
jgi:hypothetical protein